MKTTNSGSIEISYGGCRALVRQRGDGRWQVKWREARRGKSTTLVAKEGALTKAREIVRRLAGGQGGRTVSVDEAEMVARLRRMCGERHPSTVIGMIEEFVGRRGVRGLEAALRHYEGSGIADVERVTLRAAYERFLDGYDDRPWATMNALRTELRGLVLAHEGIDLVDVDAEMLESWVTRRREDGEKASERTINNRISTWMTFLNRCREWGYVARGEKHVAEGLRKRAEPRKMVPIWTPEVPRRILAMLYEEAPKHVPYLIVTCWLGLRPSEAQRLRWELFDWDRDSLFCDLSVAQKLQQERHVPINATARAMMEHWLKTQGLWSKALRGELKGRMVVKRALEVTSALAREKGIIERWDPDVTRHSYISYMIALGHSKHEIAEWAGNSEAVIRRRYRHPLRQGDGEQWFKDEA